MHQPRRAYSEICRRTQLLHPSLTDAAASVSEIPLNGVYLPEDSSMSSLQLVIPETVVYTSHPTKHQTMASPRWFTALSEVLSKNPKSMSEQAIKPHILIYPISYGALVKLTQGNSLQSPSSLHPPKSTQSQP